MDEGTALSLLRRVQRTPLGENADSADAVHVNREGDGPTWEVEVWHTPALLIHEVAAAIMVAVEFGVAMSIAPGRAGPNKGATGVLFYGKPRQ